MEITLTDIFDLVQSIKSADKTSDAFPLLGKKVFVRTITYHYTGFAAEVKSGFLHLENAAWIADSGRWKDALESGELTEVEPYPGDTYVNLASIVDVSEWLHALPKEQK